MIKTEEETNEELLELSHKLEMEIKTKFKTNRISVYGKVVPKEIKEFKDWIRKNTCASFYNTLMDSFYFEKKSELLETNFSKKD